MDGHHLCIGDHHFFDRHVGKFENALEDFFLCGFKDAVFSSFSYQEFYLFLSDIGPFGEWFFAKGPEHKGGAKGEELHKDGVDLCKGVNAPCRPEANGFRVHQGNGLGDELSKDDQKIGDDDYSDPDGNRFRSKRNGFDGKRMKIVEMVGQRISKVKLEKLPDPAEGPHSA